MVSKEYTREEAAQFLNMSPKTLEKWASTGRHNLPYTKVGREVRYAHEDLVALKERCKRTRASEPVSS